MLLEGGVVLPFPHSAHHCLLLPCTLTRALVLAIFLCPHELIDSEGVLFPRQLGGYIGALTLIFLHQKCVLP